MGNVANRTSKSEEHIMAYEERDNEGQSYKVQSKTEDWHADYQGKGSVDGKLKWFDLVGPKTAKNGEEYFTVKIRHREPWTGENKKTNKSYLDSYDPSPQKEGSDIPF